MLITADAIMGVCLAALGALGVVLLSRLLAHSRVVTPFSFGLLVLSLGSFGVATAAGAWSLIDLIRIRVEAAKRMRRIGISALIAAMTVWFIAAAVT